MAKKRSLTAAGVTRETLEQTPGRVTQFLFGLATRPTVRALLESRGYDAEEHKRGWSLLQFAGTRVIDERGSDVAAEAAVAELDNWDEPNIRLIRAALTRHPEAQAQVLEGIQPVIGPEAVLNVARILERLDALETTGAGQAALATLSKRGLDAAERKRLAALVKTAKGTGKVAAPTSSDEEYEQALLQLRDWYTEWSEITRLVVKRRDHLIRLGLAERRRAGGTDELDVVDPTPFIDPNSPTPAG